MTTKEHFFRTISLTFYYIPHITCRKWLFSNEISTCECLAVIFPLSPGVTGDFHQYESLERAMRVKRSSWGSRAMKILQTFTASCRAMEHIRKIMNSTSAWEDIIIFVLLLWCLTSKKVSAEVFPWTMGKGLRPSRENKYSFLQITAKCENRGLPSAMSHILLNIF